jgi:hypothetical protein
VRERRGKRTEVLEKTRDGKHAAVKERLATLCRQRERETER